MKHALCDSTYVTVWNRQRSPVVSVEQKSEEGGSAGAMAGGNWHVGDSRDLAGWRKCSRLWQWCWLPGWAPLSKLVFLHNSRVCILLLAVYASIKMTENKKEREEEMLT